MSNNEPTPEVLAVHEAILDEMYSGFSINQHTIAHVAIEAYTKALKAAGMVIVPIDTLVDISQRLKAALAYIEKLRNIVSK